MVASPAVHEPSTSLANSRLNRLRSREHLIHVLHVSRHGGHPDMPWYSSCRFEPPNHLPGFTGIPSSPPFCRVSSNRATSRLHASRGSTACCRSPGIPAINATPQLLLRSTYCPLCVSVTEAVCLLQHESLTRPLTALSSGQRIASLPQPACQDRGEAKACARPWRLLPAQRAAALQGRPLCNAFSTASVPGLDISTYLLTYYYAMRHHGNVFTSAENASRAFAVTLFPKSSSGRL